MCICALPVCLVPKQANRGWELYPGTRVTNGWRREWSGGEAEGFGESHTSGQRPETVPVIRICSPVTNTSADICKVTCQHDDYLDNGEKMSGGRKTLEGKKKVVNGLPQPLPFNCTALSPSTRTPSSAALNWPCRKCWTPKCQDLVLHLGPLLSQRYHNKVLGVDKRRNPVLDVGTVN